MTFFDADMLMWCKITRLPTRTLTTWHESQREAREYTYSDALLP